MITILSIEPAGAGLVKVTGKSVLGQEVSRMLKAPDEATFRAGVNALQHGALVQEVFPTFTADDREFLISGITEADFDDLCDI